MKDCQGPLRRPLAVAIAAVVADTSSLLGYCGDLGLLALLLRAFEEQHLSTGEVVEKVVQL